MRVSGLLVLALAVSACGSSGSEPAGDAPVEPLPDARDPLVLRGTRELCKLLVDHGTGDPTPNDVQHRANVLGADLGIPVVHDDRFYLLFGDTIGFRGIWGPTESHPDSIGYGTDSAAAIAAQPDLLCTRLAMVSLPPAQSLGPSIDPTVTADFAGVAMAAPAGHALGEFIHNPAGGVQRFAYLPGDFEVPSGAFASGDSIYVFYTTVASSSDVTMAGSYLARWIQPAPTSAPVYQIAYAVDERFDANGPLTGDFINIAAEVHHDDVYLFGTGDYRRSGIELARKRLDTLATPGSFERLGTIVATPGYGEVSVRYFAAVDRWVLLAEELLPGSNRIVAYTAARPEGPWSAPVIIHDMADPAFRSAYCCAGADDCRGEQVFDCARTGFYGTYLFPDVIVGDREFTITYTMSSFAPYNVALFQATFADRAHERGQRW